ncbi:ArsR/SmtB family transcription factor [Desulforamulus aquiferis]|uniref:Metalloregulator ArsR/SmtB family transcription factor n=1 Tax=Desulforamulus aquiferis TaxID=1397668 RepID=A0AAW7ZA54_9FIRM|nr:metalloregulator ArsR/SmtB family transcription factor [Desulforamulus aquiferis]MDO7786303.1 metalloregulator ArsR/SmtB family transcription factor [Desulforamulus aquiferis]RYD05002.1 hypothetical protein N752_11605 [Desulforamulus aquiferis]
MDKHFCDIHCTDEADLLKIKKNSLDEEVITKLSAFFKALSDPTRLRIIYALSQTEELCVYHICCILEMSPSSISHQLRVLRQMDLVKTRKEAQSVYYSLKDKHVLQTFNQGLEHVLEQFGGQI